MTEFLKVPYTVTLSVDAVTQTFYVKKLTEVNKYIMRYDSQSALSPKASIMQSVDMDSALPV